MVWDPITLTEGDIAGSLMKIKPYKALGPDSLKKEVPLQGALIKHKVFYKIIPGSD